MEDFEAYIDKTVERLHFYKNTLTKLQSDVEIKERSLVNLRAYIIQRWLIEEENQLNLLDKLNSIERNIIYQ